MDEQSMSSLIQWFATPIRYYLKLLHEDTISEILKQEQKKQAQRRASPETL
jgi:hypothetical protein